MPAFIRIHLCTPNAFASAIAASGCTSEYLNPIERGHALALSLTGGQAHDITQAAALSAQVQPGAVPGDKGHGSDAFLQSLQIRAIKAVIPPGSNRIIKRDCDFVLYRERNLVERFFNTIIHLPGIATRYEKTARNFLAALHLMCALTWLE